MEFVNREIFLTLRVEPSSGFSDLGSPIASSSAMTWSRRQFLTTMSAAGGLLAPRSQAAKNPPGPLPPPTESGIEHIIILMMENRSFDHFFGWIPGTDGQQSG